MAITYIRGPNPIWFFNNLTGQVLDDTYYAFFLTNDLPYIPQAVYQDPNGISPWSDPIEFQPSGGLPNNLYFNPTETYRIEIRQGPNQTDPLIWLVQNYQPGEGGSGGSTISDQLTVAANLIVDPNFSDVFFSSPFTYTQGSPGTYTLNIAPGWQLILTGAGTTVLTQGVLSGTPPTPSNPAYYLQINNTGWTTAVLSQVLPNNGAIFAGGAVAVTFTAQAVTSNALMTVNYVPNGPANSTTIFPQQTITTGGFLQYYGANNIPASQNTNTDGNANVQIQFVLPGTGNVEISNIQVVGQSTPLSVNFTPPSGTMAGSVPNYQELTYPQIANGEFNVYRDSLVLHPKDTIITGWNFALNPWQFATKTVSNIAGNQYTADQTIVLQQEYIATAGVTQNNIQVGQSGAPFNYGLQVNAAKANNQFALLQYIDPNIIRPYWTQNLSAMVKALLTTTQNSQIKFKMRLIYIAGLPSSTSASYPISSWTAGSDPTFAAGVTAIAPQNDPVYTLNSATPMLFPFDKFTLPATTDPNMTLGILIYTISNMSTTGPDFIVFNDISLVQNDFATLSNPQTFAQVLKDCQYYYEMSYESFAAVGTATTASQVEFTQTAITGGGSTTMYPTPFSISWKTPKRPGTTNTPTFYSPNSGTSGQVYSKVWANDYASTAAGDYAITNFNIQNGINNVSLEPASGAANGAGVANTVAPAVGGLTLHYTMNARLG